MDRRVKGISRGINRSKVDVDTLVKKSIAQVKELKYTPNNGKPDQVRDLREEVSDGTF
jgi:hypothetical protein